MPRFSGPLQLVQQAAPAQVSGRTQIYAKTDGKVYAKDHNGVEYDLTAQPPTDYVALSGNQTIEGNKTFNGSVTVGSTFTLKNPGVGVDSIVNFAKTNDSASISVLEYSSDATRYAFQMSDNPDGVNDYFTWAITDWQNPGSGWSPITFQGLDTTLNARYTTVNGDLTLVAGAYVTSNNGTSGQRRDFWRTTTPTLAAGTGTLTLTVDASGYNGSTTAMWVRLIDASTFEWGNGSPGNAPVQTGLAVSTSDTTLSNGIKVRFSSLTGGVAGDRWSMRAYRGGRLTSPNFLASNDGTAAAPAFRFGDASNTGMYSPTTDQVALSAGGTQRLLANATGVTVTGSLLEGANRVYSAGNPPPYPVTSVNTRTGAVTGLVEDTDPRLSDARTPTAHVHAAADITSGVLATARLGTGTADSTTFLRGDGTWQTVSTGAPANMVTTDTTQTISGAKTFSTAPVVPDSSFTIAKISATGTRNATTFLRGDGTFATPPDTIISPASTVVSGTSFGQAAAVGTGTLYARNDHSHGTPANPVSYGNVTAQTSYGAASGNGSASTLSRSDHVHGTPALGSSAGGALSFGGTGAAGSATTPPRNDHTHTLPQVYYQVVRGNGTAATQRNALNIIPGAGISVGVVDDSANNETEVTLSAPTMVTTDTVQTITGSKSIEWTAGFAGLQLLPTADATSGATTVNGSTIAFWSKRWTGAANENEFITVGAVRNSASDEDHHLSVGGELRATSLREGANRVYSINNKVPVGGISATGTPSSSTFLRGDGTWATPTAAPPSNMVTTDTTQTISGAKTFSTGVIGVSFGTSSDGTASSPAFKFGPTSDTGLYSPGTDQAAISAGGAGRLTITTTAVATTGSVTLSEGSNRVYSAGNKVPVAGITATGTANATKFLRGDWTWSDDLPQVKLSGWGSVLALNNGYFAAYNAYWDGVDWRFLNNGWAHLTWVSFVREEFSSSTFAGTAGSVITWHKAESGGSLCARTNAGQSVVGSTLTAHTTLTFTNVPAGKWVVEAEGFYNHSTTAQGLRLGVNCGGTVTHIGYGAQIHTSTTAVVSSTTSTNNGWVGGTASAGATYVLFKLQGSFETSTAGNVTLTFCSSGAGTVTIGGASWFRLTAANG